MSELIGDTALPTGLAAPVPAADGLDLPFWEGLRRHELVIQHCSSCGRFQWGPEWICGRCLSFDLGWESVEPRGKIFSWERVWHPIHPALASAVPYVIVLVELAGADDVRIIGNLAADPTQEITIGSEVAGSYEDHNDGPAPYTLLQWLFIENPDALSSPKN